MLVDILRATTTICTVVGNSVEAIIPVASHEEARRLKSEGILVATEKDGVQLDFADFGNSAFSFTRDAIGGKTLVYCTTNGTRARDGEEREQHRDDSAAASMDLWDLAEGDVLGYVEKAAHRHRLKKLGLDDVIPNSFACDQVDVVPVFDGTMIKGYAAPPPTA